MGPQGSLRRKIWDLAVPFGMISHLITLQHQIPPRLRRLGAQKSHEGIAEGGFGDGA